MNRRARILGYREAQILKLVETDMTERGLVRSYDQIAAALGMCGRNGVCNVVRRLERRGLVQRIGLSEVTKWLGDPTLR